MPRPAKKKPVQEEKVLDLNIKFKGEYVDRVCMAFLASDMKCETTADIEKAVRASVVRMMFQHERKVAAQAASDATLQVQGQEAEAAMRG